jgi:acyl-coenzyme A synthetase/AMP-(fatty) acid ligase/3-hydroxymyristoyl/3-hydroxydecanoyl-(acyl carrier protein) dehydratase
MRPIFEGFAPSSVIAWRGGERLTAGAALAAARRLARALPPSRYAINVCDALDHFLVATLAALVGGRTLILPAARLPRVLADLRTRYPDSVCVADRAAACADATALVDPWVDAALRERDDDVAAWPALPDDCPAAILFTSGSTGEPQPHPKTWGELADGARALMRSIGTPPPGVAILGTLPPQHMFGFETTVMLPLHSGAPVLAARPAFAADLADTLAHSRALAPGGVWLMTIPLQLRAFHREYPALHGVANVVASTMPLDPDHARAVERDWNTPVHEIYGCTEGGILAVRRASVATAWTPVAGVRFAITPDGRAEASGGHLRGVLALADRLRPVDEHGAFELVGRDSDLVKIAGKRASLAGLTRELLAIAGVDDGAVFLPHPEAPRLAALAVAPGLEVDKLRQELARRIDAAFLPRPLVLVDALPRNAAGKLSLEALRAAVTRAGARAGTGAAVRTLTGQMTFARDHPALPGHFPGRPIVPGVLLLASVEDVLRADGLRVVGCAQAKFLAPVLPEQVLMIRVDVDERADAHFEIVAAERTVAAGSLRCVRDGAAR